MRKQAPAALEKIEAEARAAPFAEGLFFRIDRDGISPSYLFGTLHVADSRVGQLSPQVRDALSKSATLMLETTDPSTFSTNAQSVETRRSLQRALVAPPDRRPDRLLDREDFLRLARAAQASGLPSATLAKLKPEVVALLLATPKCGLAAGSSEPIIDVLVASEARQKGLKIVGLETLTQQLEALDGISAAAARQLLLSTIVQSEHGDDIVETTIRRYLDRRPGELLAWMRSDAVVPGQNGSETPKVFLDRLVRRRNETMLREALPLLQQGGVFIAVGAAHIPGDDGLAELVVQRGFRVTEVH